MLWVLLSACFQYTELSIEQMDSLDHQEQIKLIKQYKKQSEKSKYTLQQKEQMLKATLQMSSNVYGPKAPETIILISTLGIFYGQEARNFDAAEDHLLRSNKLWLELQGADSSNYITSAENLVYFYEDYEVYENGIPFYEVAYNHHKSEYGIDDEDAKYFGVGLLTEYQVQFLDTDKEENPKEYEFYMEKSRELFELLLPLEHTDIDRDFLQTLYPKFLFELKEYDALKAYIDTHKPNTKDDIYWQYSAMSCQLKAIQNGIDDGLLCFERLLDDVDSFSDLDPYVHIIQSKMDFAELLVDSQNLTKSLKFLEDIYIAVLQEEGADSLNGLLYGNMYANVLTELNQLPKAKEVFLHLLATEGDPNSQLESVDYHITKNNLANLYANNGEYQLAKDLYIQRLQHDPGSVGKGNLAFLYLDLGEYDTAVELYEELTADLDILQIDKTVIEDFRTKLHWFEYLARGYGMQGEYVKSLDLTKQVYQIRLREFGEKDRQTLSSLNSLYVSYGQVGDVEKKKELKQEILRLYPVIVEELENNYLHFLLFEFDDLVKEKKFESAIQLLRNHRLKLTELSDVHPDVITIRKNIADVYVEQGDYSTARHEYASIVSDIETKFGKENLLYCEHLNNVANAYHLENNIQKAINLFEESLTIRSEIIGEQHHSLSYTFQQLAGLYNLIGNYEKVLEYQSKMFDLEQNLLHNNLRGTEESKRQMLSLFDETTSNILTHGLSDPDTPELARFAFKTLISRHNLVQDLQMIDQKILRLRQSDKALDEAYRELQDALIYEKQIQKNLNDEFDADLYQSVRQRILTAEENLYSKVDVERPLLDINLDDLQAEMPKDSVLIEYIWFTPYPSNVVGLKDVSQLVGFTFDDEGNVSVQSLGTYESLRRQIQAFRQTQSPLLGKSLFQTVVQPLLANTDSVEHIYIAPDGDLSTIPFELMVVDDGDLLIDHATINYLSSGRDLVRKSNPSPENLSAVVFANPTYAEQDELTPLPHTQTEATMLLELFPNSVVYSGVEATVDRLYNVSKPNVLHIATHGFFEPDNPSIGYDDNPMTRSGLFLGKGSDMGTRILASEIVTLDLEGTDLVVLSACESGLADTSSGDGAYGMRHAFSLAGAQNQVLSLWPVDDDATAHFMEQFYKKLANGVDKSTAIRETKLTMRNDGQWSSPRQWGAFILIGK